MSTIADSLLSLFNANKHSDVISTSKQASLNTSLDPYASRIVAASYFKLGDFSAADRILTDLESIFHTDADFFSLIAANTRRLGDFDRSSIYFKKALELDSSIFIRNNYANLLIDLKQFREAKILLEAVLTEAPDYLEAKSNLDRVKLLMEDTDFSNAVHDEKTQNKNFNFMDPLLMAFEPDEVSYAHERYGKKGSTKKSNSLNLDNDLPHPSTRSVALEQLSLIPHFLENKRWQSVLKICSSIHLLLGPDARVYDFASDAYLNLKLYRESEICLQHSIALGGITLKRALNMVSFCLMRNDFLLAEYYIQKASSVDSSSSAISKFKAMLISKRKNSPSSEQISFPSSWPS